MNKVIQAMRAVEAKEAEEIDLDIDTIVEEATTAGNTKSKVEQSMDSASKLIKNAENSLDEMQSQHRTEIEEMHLRNEGQMRGIDEDIQLRREEIERLRNKLLDAEINRTQTIHRMGTEMQKLVTEHTRAEADQLHVINSLRAMESALKLPISSVEAVKEKEEPVMDTAAFKKKPVFFAGAPKKEPIKKPDDDEDWEKRLNQTEPAIIPVTSSYVDQDADKATDQTEASTTSDGHTTGD